ncbi:MAG: ATP-binding cassette domain-containing protein [Clostridium butyricum]|nr:ATP-binding cassette domain-containing protein [Clostridium butyricum]
MSLYVDIEKQFSSFKLKVNFESKNEVLGLLGESGSGKSITLKCISGLITPDKGQIILNDKVFFDSEKKINLSPQLRNTGYLFQNYALFPTMKIKDNIKIGIADMQKEKQNLLMKEYIKKFGLSGLENRYPWQLSGGQMQRVALARALITSPDILLLDEPFSALDMHLRNNMEKELLSIIKDFNKNVVFVTHDISEAYRVCDEIIVYENGNSLKKRNKYELFTHPKTLSEARLTGCKNISKASKISDNSIMAEDFGYEFIFSEKVPDDIHYLCIRSHNINISENINSRNTYPYTITNIIENPFDYTLYIRKDLNSKNKPIEFTMSKDNFNYKIGDFLYVKFMEDKLFYF